MSYVEDRIYLTEVEGVWGYDESCGHHIIVLTPKGVTLQIYTPIPEVLREFSGSQRDPGYITHAAHFDGRLVVAVLNCDRLFALQGL